MQYEIFKRTWWKKNPSWPNGREPQQGRSNHVKYVETEAEAREICREANKELAEKSNPMGMGYEFTKA